MRFKSKPEVFPIPSSMKNRDMTGMKFGRLEVIGLGLKSSRQHRWVCRCDCGFYTLTFGFSLRRGESRSCGCIAAEKTKERWKSADAEKLRKRLSENASNVSHRLSKHPLYSVWIDMKGRCYKPANKFYKDYGGRGIKVCEKWFSFKNFYDDMIDGWEKGLQIGRINNDGDYEPGNCRWETPCQQQRNRRDTVFVETPSGRMKLADAADKYGLTPNCIRYRIEAGWAPDKVFLTKSQRERIVK